MLISGEVDFIVILTNSNIVRTDRLGRKLLSRGMFKQRKIRGIRELRLGERVVPGSEKEEIVNKEMVI